MKYFNLKGLQTIGLATLLFIGVLSCRKGNTTNMVTKSDNFYQKISYRGRVVFKQDQTGIESIAKDGFVKFERNGRKVEAEADSKGQITYEFNGDDKITSLNADQQQFIASAVKTIIKERNRQLGAKR